MKHFFNSTLPLPNKRSILYEALFLTAYTLFVLFLFQPFGTHEYTHTYKLAQLSGYGLLVLLCYPATRYGFAMLSASGYTIKHEALHLFVSFVVLIFLAFFYYAFVIYGSIAWPTLVPFVINGLILLIPAFFALLYRARIKAKRAHEPSPPIQEISHDGKLEIKGNNQYENFYFNVADVLYLRSNGNYVMIYFQKDGNIKHEMVRNTLNQVSGQLAGADFIPIHRSFLVNAKKFDRLLREDGKHILVNQQFDIRLPVSRAHVSNLEKKLKDHS